MDADIKAASLRTGLLGKPSNRITNPLRVACVVFPAALFFGLAWVDYREELARTRNDVASATNALAEHARTVVETVNLVLARVLDHVDHQDWATLAGSPDTHEFLDQLRRDLPQVEAVFLTDPTGTIAAGTRAYPTPSTFITRNISPPPRPRTAMPPSSARHSSAQSPEPPAS